MNSIKGYTCSCCGEHYDELPISYGFAAPAYYQVASPEERDRRFKLCEDHA